MKQIQSNSYQLFPGWMGLGGTFWCYKNTPQLGLAEPVQDPKGMSSSTKPQAQANTHRTETVYDCTRPPPDSPRPPPDSPNVHLQMVQFPLKMTWKQATSSFTSGNERKSTWQSAGAPETGSRENHACDRQSGRNSNPELLAAELRVHTPRWAPQLLKACTWEVSPENIFENPRGHIQRLKGCVREWETS